MAVTYEPIASQTLGSSATTVTFSSVASTWTDLILVAVFKMGSSTFQPIVRVNSDTGTNYSTTSLRGDGSTATSQRHTSISGWFPIPGPGIGSSGEFNIYAVQIMSYANTSVFKTALSAFVNPSSYVARNVHLWRSTSTITAVSVTAESGSGDFQSGSTFSLYGIKAA